MTVRLVGEGPAIDAVAAALSDVDVRVERGGIEGLADASLGVVCATAGDAAFERATGIVESEDAGIDRWIAIEVGGIGGVPVDELDVAIAGFAAGGPCYRCLQRRVEANGAEAADAPSADRSAVRMAGAIAGREIVRTLAGEDRLSGRVFEVPHAERELLPVPGCACGGGTMRAGALDGPTPRTDEDRPLEETVARMDRAIDPRAGIVAEIGEVESFPAPYYLATLADTTGISDGDAPRQAAGIADDWNAALAKGVGEALERYGGALYRTGEFERATPAALEDAVAPAAFSGADADAPGSDADQSIPWVRGEALTPGGRGDDARADDDPADAWLPAAAVHFPPPEPRVLPGITTGLGLGSSGVDALLAGLTETIERDATMCAWYSTFEPLGLSVADEAFERLAKRARSEDLTVTPLLVTQDVDVPVVSVAVHREDPWPRFAVGSAADLDPTAAATGALEEAIQNWMELRSIGREQALGREDAIGHFADLPDAAREFVDVEPAVAASDVGPAEPPAGEAALEALVEAIDDAGMEAYAARLTTRDLEALGFEAVRVLVPSAQPLFTGEARFGERAESVPQSLGFEARLDREHHPYP